MVPWLTLWPRGIPGCCRCWLQCNVKLEPCCRRLCYSECQQQCTQHLQQSQLEAHLRVAAVTGLRIAIAPASFHLFAGEDAIKHLLSRGTHWEFNYGSLIVMLVFYFLGAVWAAGSAIASGLFVPMLLIGACVGRLVGLLFVHAAAARGRGSPG